MIVTGNRTLGDISRIGGDEVPVCRRLLRILKLVSLPKLIGNIVFLLSCINASSALGAIHEVGADQFSEKIYEVVALAEPGDLVLLPAGRFSLNRGLVVGTRGLTIRGKGRTETILDFSDQKVGGQSILLAANKMEVSGLTILNPPADGLVARSSRGVRITDVAVEWAEGRKQRAGGYGIYPVRSSGVHIEDCYAKGATEAGIYVGQSVDGVVRSNVVEGNVVGIDIENSMRIVVEDNEVFRNSIGVLVSARPGLFQPKNLEVIVRQNDVRENNLPNFAADTSHLAILGEGTGIAVIAAIATDVKNNRLASHDRSHLLFLNYASLDLEKVKDPFYRPDLVDSRLSGNVFVGEDERSRVASNDWRNAKGFEVIWDGIVTSRKLRSGAEPVPMCRDKQAVSTFLDTQRSDNQPTFSESVPSCESVKDDSMRKRTLQ